MVKAGHLGYPRGSEVRLVHARQVMAVGLLGVVLSLFGCDGCGTASKPSGGAAKGKPAPAGPAVQEGAACAHKTCETCVGEGGCWWCKTTKRCTLDKAPGCKVEVNELSDCQ
jgi:hypothetical protein